MSGNLAGGIQFSQNAPLWAEFLGARLVQNNFYAIILSSAKNKIAFFTFNAKS
jgi:hypothetical protein